MATIVDERDEEIKDTPEAQTTEDFADITKHEPEQATHVEQTVDDLPDKYRGKSVKEIVAMHQEAERMIGRQGDEVGQLRKVVDDYIKTATDNTSTKESEEDVDFFTDPDKAVERKISNHPAVKKALETLGQYEMANNASAIRAKYPKAEQYLKDPSFNEWMQGSQYRQTLFQKANALDFGAIDEMLGLWEERVNLVNQTAEAETSSRSRQIKQGSTGNASGSRAVSGKKTYRRADIIKLMQTDPDRYQELQPEIMAAYAEGRVK